MMPHLHFYAASLMRHVFDDREVARELGARAARGIRQSHSPRTAGDIMCRRLEAIKTAGRTRRAGDPTKRRPPWLPRLASQIEQGPEPDSAPERRPAKDLARRAAFKLVMPFIRHQQGVNSGLVDALDDLSTQLSDLRREASLDRTRWLSGLRRCEQLTLLAETQAQTIAKLERALDARADPDPPGPGSTLSS